MVFQRKPPVRRLFNGPIGSAFAHVNDEPLVVQEAPQQQVKCSAEGCASVYLVPVGEVVAPNFIFTCVDHTPQNKRAEAKAPNKNEIGPEVQRMIKDSLASVPRTIPDQRTVKGTKKTADTLLTSTTTTKKSFAGQRSEPIPFIPGVSPATDDNDNPIVRPRGDQEIASDLLENPDLASAPGCCRHFRPPDNCFLCGTKKYTERPLPTYIQECKHHNDPDSCFFCYKPPRLSHAAATEIARRTLGLPDSKAKQTSTGMTIVHGRFIYYPALLGISRVQLNDLIDLQVGTWPLPIKETVLKSTAQIENQITSEREMLERYSLWASELNHQIADSEELIRSWGKKVMEIQYEKIGRPLDEIPEDKVRNAWIREEKALIDRYNREILALQKYMRESKLTKLQERLNKWGSNADDFVIVTTHTMDIPVTFREKFVPSPYKEDRELTLDQYSALMGTTAGEWEVIDKRTWAKIRHFENELLFQLIGWGLIHPSEKALSLYPELSKYKDSKSRIEVYPWTEDSYTDQPELSALIIKTGGTEIGASIHNFGFTRKGTPRMSGSFDLPPGKSKGVPGENTSQGSESFFGDLDSGDVSERGGDE
jgi:hypothetical protein